MKYTCMSGAALRQNIRIKVVADLGLLKKIQARENQKKPPYSHFHKDWIKTGRSRSDDKRPAGLLL